MKKLFAMLLLMVSLSAQAGFEVDNESIVAKGFDTACPAATQTLSFSQTLITAAFQGAVTDTSSGKRLEVLVKSTQTRVSACYFPIDSTRVLVIDENGDAGFLELGKGL